MVQKREAYAPWSLTRKAGVESATVNGDIEVPQFIQPTLDTGFVDEKGDWKGRQSSDEQFFAFAKDEAVANGATILAPQSSTGNPPWILDMTGFNDLQLAVRPTNGGNFAIQAVMAPADFASVSNHMNDAFNDGAEAMTADVWNIYMIKAVLSNQKLLQFKITNNSGGESDIETAFLRLV